MWTAWEHEEHFLRSLKGLFGHLLHLLQWLKNHQQWLFSYCLDMGVYVEKTLDVLVIWLVTPESIIQELLKVVPEIFSLIENGNLPEYAKNKNLRASQGCL